MKFGRKLKLTEMQKIRKGVHFQIKRIPTDCTFLLELRAAYKAGYLGVTRDPLLAGSPHLT